MSPWLAVFDCDGTLVDSAHVIITAMEAAFDRHDQQMPDQADVRRVVGLSLPQAMARLLPDAPSEQHLSMAGSYKEAFMDLRSQGIVTDKEVLYPGVVDCLYALNEAGFLLGVATGKSTRGLHKTLEHHNLKHLFVTLQTADGHPSKPHPSMMRTAMADAGIRPSKTLLVGDTTYDMEMARAADVAAIGVTWGYHGEQDLLDAGAHEIHNSYDRLTDALLRRAQKTP